MYYLDANTNDIARRFKENVKRYMIIIREIFHISIDEDFWNDTRLQSNETGIETLSGFLHEYIKNKIGTAYTDNDEYRLQDLIACIGITSIFYTENGKIDQEFDIFKLPRMDDYDFTFSLNYFEFWDKGRKCIHLHGFLDLDVLPSKKETILISQDRMHFQDYHNAVETIKNSFSTYIISANDIVFAPNGIKKNDLICVSGFYPSNRLYPANDLFLYRSKDLYNSLSKVDELDIFGMSPYGDDALIDIINSMKKVRVFVYNKCSNKETSEWERKLTCKYEIYDSDDLK